MGEDVAVCSSVSSGDRAGGVWFRTVYKFVGNCQRISLKALRLIYYRVYIGLPVL